MPTRLDEDAVVALALQHSCAGIDFATAYPYPAITVENA